MRIVFGWVLSLGVLCTSGVVGAQDFFPESKPFFELLAEKTQGRIKQALMENIDGQPGDELIILERRGQYPQWKGALSVWNIDERGLKQRGEITFPDDVIYFGFVKPNVDDLSLVLRTKAGIQIGVWKLDHWAFQPKHQLVRDLQPSLIDSSYARYYPLVQETLGDRQVLFLPSVMGLDVVQIPFGKNVESVSQLTDIRRAYNRSPLGVLPFEPQFVYQFMFWFPSLRVQKQNSGVTLYSSWMDEVQIIELSPQLKVQSKEVRRFHLLSEDERNSGVSFVNTDAMDINHDGIVDYMSNQFTGSGTNFSAKTRLFFQKEGASTKKEKKFLSKRCDQRRGHERCRPRWRL
ncbi:MAG: hypothetical protein R3A11_09300 [Bdellovibrionota bacterium]